MSNQKSIGKIVEEFFEAQNNIWKSETGLSIAECKQAETGLLIQILQSERDRAEEEKEKLLDTVKTVFSVYLAVFPKPRDNEQKAIQDVIKQSVRNLKDNIIEALTNSQDKQ